MIRAFLAFATATLALVAHPAAQRPYGNHDLTDMIDPASGTLDRDRYDAVFADLAEHAQNYPPQFASERGKERARLDAQRLGAIASRWIARDGGDPTSSADLIRAGRIWAIAHNLDVADAAQNADAAFQRAAEAYPDDAEVHFHFGAFLSSTATGQQRARTHLERAVALGNKPALWGLSLNYLMAGDSETALKHLEAYGEAFPDDERVGQLRQAIRSGAVERHQANGDADTEPARESSVVILLRAHRALEIDALRAAVKRALGENAASGDDSIDVRGNRALVRLEDFALMIVAEPSPAIADVEAFAESIDEARLQAAVRAHKATLRVLASPSAAPHRDKIRASARLAAELMGDRGLAVSFSDEPRLFAVTETTAKRLTAANPLAAMKLPDQPAVLMAENDDPKMQKAIAKARASLDELRQHLAAGVEGFVKIQFEEGEFEECMWVSIAELGDESGRGVLDNDPVWISQLDSGDRVSFAIGDILDWTCTVDGERKGGFTIPVLLRDPVLPSDDGSKDGKEPLSP